MDRDRLTVRFASPSDAPTIVEFVRGLAVFERLALEHVRLSEADVLRDGFGDRPLFEVLIAERAGRPLGMALFFPHYSTWAGAPGLYVEDLFVVGDARRQGIGRALVAACARVARARGVAARRPCRPRLEPGTRLLRSPRLRPAAGVAALPRRWRRP